MDFQLSLQNYLKYCSEQSQFTRRSLERYDYLLHIYYEFLFMYNHMNGDTLSPYLNGVTPEEIFQSLEYYIDSRPVKSEDTARLYISVIKEFFRYLNMVSTIHSPKLIESFGLKDDDPNSFAYKYNDFLEYLHRAEKIATHIEDKLLTESEIIEVIGCCNQNLSLSEIARLPNKKDSHNRFVKALIVKLILLTGVKFTPKIKSLKKGDLDLNKGILRIGDFQIHLPFNLRVQFNNYMDICYCKSDDDPLFLFYGNKHLSTPNELISIFSYKVKITSTISLAKYAILEMIDAGIDKHTILEFTGYGNDVYNPCKEISELGRMENSAKMIDNTIKCLPLFDVL